MKPQRNYAKSLHLTNQLRSRNKMQVCEYLIKNKISIVLLHGFLDDGTCTCGQSGCKKGKHPLTKFFPKGVHSATQDINIIKKAFKLIPCANLAISLKGLTAVDIDGPEGEKLVKGLNLPNTIGVKSGRGHHLYYSGELPGGTFKANQLDVLTGEDRYIIIPPSIHGSGKKYRWEWTDAQEAAPVPDILNSLRVKQKKQAEPGRLIREGDRNTTMFKISCGLRRWLDEEASLEVMGVINKKACEFPVSDQELAAIVRNSGRYSTNVGELFGPPTIRESLPMDFLAYPYIPRHGVTILAGDPGRGKSLLLALLIALSTNPNANAHNSLPGMEGKKPKKVLLLSAEDNWARVTLARLERFGVDLDNLHVMHRFNALSEDCMQALNNYVQEWKPDLILIDTLSAYMGGTRDMHRQNEVGEFLARLNEVAEEHGCAIVGLAHLNKSSGEHPLYRIVGSIGFAATVRSALFLGTNPADRSQLALAHGKANGTEKGKTLIFEKVGGTRDRPPLLQFMGYSEATELEVCQVDKGAPGRTRSESDAATEFVLGFLTGKPVTWDVVEREAESRSIASVGTLNRVRCELAKEGRIKQIGNAKASKWMLNKPPTDETCE